MHQAAIRDITEQMAARKEVEQQRAFLRQIIDASPNFIYVTDREGRIELINRFAAESYGQTPEAMAGLFAEDLAADKSALVQMRRDTQRLIDQEVDRIDSEHAVLDHDGRQHWIRLIKVPMLDECGQVEHIISTVMDISELKERERELQASEARYRVIFEQALNPILITDESKRYIDANQAALDFLECSREELLATDIMDWAVPGGRESKKKAYDAWGGSADRGERILGKGEDENPAGQRGPGVPARRPDDFVRDRAGHYGTNSNACGHCARARHATGPCSIRPTIPF